MERFRDALCQDSDANNRDKQKLAEFEAQCHALESQCQALREESGLHAKTLDELRASQHRLEEELQQVKAGEAAAREGERLAQTVAKQVQEEIRIVRTELENARAQLAEAEHASARLTVTEQERNRLRQELEDAQVEVAKRDKAINILAQDLAEARAQLAQVEQVAVPEPVVDDRLKPELDLNRALDFVISQVEPEAESEPEPIDSLDDISELLLSSEILPSIPEPTEPTGSATDKTLTEAATEANSKSAESLDKTRIGRRPLIGQLLLESKAVSLEQLEEAMVLQAANSNRHLGDVLIELGYASEESVARVLAVQCHTTYLKLDQENIESDAVALVSERLAQQHVCIPVRSAPQGLVLAMANPLNLLAVEDIERATGTKVEVVVATPTDIRDAIAKYYWEPE